MKELLEGELKYSPLGYRVWRAITKLVTLSDLHGSPADELRIWSAGSWRAPSNCGTAGIYAGRALDMEPAIAVPEAWSPPGENDWVTRLLLRRAENADATIRERSAAAMGLWERAVRVGDQPTMEQARRDLGQLITEFSQAPGQRSRSPMRPPLDSCHAWGGHRVREASVQRLAASGRPLVPACQACGPRAGPSGHP